MIVLMFNEQEEFLSYQFTYITCSDEAEARKIATRLVELGLAACCNIVPKIKSVYRWDGEVVESCEVLLLAKSKESKLGEIETLVKEMHSYDSPCVLSVPIIGGLKSYLTWLDDNLEETN